MGAEAAPGCSRIVAEFACRPGVLARRARVVGCGAPAEAHRRGRLSGHEGVPGDVDATSVGPVEVEVVHDAATSTRDMPAALAWDVARCLCEQVLGVRVSEVSSRFVAAAEEACARDLRLS